MPACSRVLDPLGYIKKAAPEVMPDMATDTDADLDIGTDPDIDLGSPEEMDLNSDGVIDEQEVEKYSAQVLRRLHRDNTLLLEQYDEISELLEHEDIGGHLQNKLQNLAAELDEIELLFEKYHPNAAPLDGIGMDDELGDADSLDEPVLDEEMMEEELPEEDLGEEEMMEEELPEEDLGEEEMMEEDGELGPEEEDEEIDELEETMPEEELPAEPADSDDEELPAPEEVAEGMQTKELRRRLVKALRNQYGKSKEGIRDMDIEDGHIPGTEAAHQEYKDKNAVMDISEREKIADGVAGVSKGKKAFHKGDLEEQIAKKGIDVPESTTEHEKPDTDQMNPVGEQFDRSFMPLPKDKHKTVGEASDFLKKMSNNTDFSNKDRMEAYHYKRALEEIGSDGSEDYNMKYFKNLLGMDSAESKSIKDKYLKSFKEMDEQINLVNVHDPSGYRLDLGNEPMQQFCGSSLIKKKNFSEMEKADTEVDVTSPNGYNPKLGNEPMQQFGGPSLVKKKGLEDGRDDRSFSHHRRAIDSARGFLGKLADTMDFGHPHRQECLVHHIALSDAHSALDPMLDAIDDVDVNMPDSNEQVSPENSPDEGNLGEITPDEVGDVGEKGVSLVTKPKKKFKEMKDAAKEVEVTKPKSPSKMGPTDPAQKFGKKEEKSKKVLPAVAAGAARMAVPMAAQAIGGAMAGGDDKGIKGKSLEIHVTRQTLLRQSEQLSELEQQLNQLANELAGNNGNV
ncbi:hypothetical protein C4577_07635 [Candidatus Parcubacteria bacterium]|nr:MAG: hypothetical protein C4577_07635 [Candidatus Parcubacteria bacterium]